MVSGNTKLKNEGMVKVRSGVMTVTALLKYKLLFYNSYLRK